MHFHKWGKWTDVGNGLKVAPRISCLLPVFTRVAIQQRRCSICNKVKQRYN